MNNSRIKAIPIKIKIAMFNQLAELYKAGVPLLKISQLPSLWHNSISTTQIRAFQNAIKEGQSLFIAMNKSRLFSSFDLAVIESAEASGQLVKIFEYLSSKYQLQIDFMVSIKSKIMYPAGSLVAALFILPFPDLFTSKITLTQYLSQTVGLILVICATIYLGAKFILSALSNPESEPALSKVIYKIPVVGTIYNQLSLEDFFNSLQLLTESGIQVMQACKQFIISSRNSNIRNMSMRIYNSLEAGNSLSESFIREPLVTDNMYIYLETAETTGEINKAFSRISELIRENIQKKINIISAVLPKVIFFALVIYMTYGLLQNQAERFKMLDSI